MSLRRQLLAFGILGVLAAACGFVWAWSLERRVVDDVTRPHPWPKDKRDA